MSIKILQAKYKIKRKLASANWEKAYYKALWQKVKAKGSELTADELAEFRNYWTDRALNLRDRHLFVPEKYRAEAKDNITTYAAVTMRDRSTGSVNVVFSSASEAAETAVKAHSELIEGLDYVGWELIETCGTFAITKADRLPNLYGYTLSDQVLWNKVKANLDKSYDVKVKSFYEIHEEANPEDYPRLLTEWYRAYMGKDLNLDNPASFNEKIQWLKIFDATEEKALLADKYEVRNIISQKIGDDYLINLLGVYDDPEDIDFDSLPDRFVIKANHGCKFNIIVTDKNKLNVESTKKKLRKWLETDFSFNFLEMHYSLIKPRITIEEYLENDNAELFDYKVFCFDGKPEYIQFIADRKDGKRMAFYDTDWKLQPFISNGQPLERDLERPERLEELLEVARKLSEGFCFARVDFYVLNDGSLKFGELTFTPGSGTLKWNPAEYNMILGNKITLPDRKVSI